MRHELLPLLCSFNPRAVEHLCATASLLAQDADYLNAAARAAAGRDGAGRKALLALPDAVRSRVLKRLLFEAQGGEVERRDVARLEALLEARTGTQIELRGGAAAWVDAERLYVGRPPQESAFAVPFAAPGRTQTPRGAFVAVADRLSRPGGAHEACIDWTRCRRTPSCARGGRATGSIRWARRRPETFGRDDGSKAPSVGAGCAAAVQRRPGAVDAGIYDRGFHQNYAAHGADAAYYF